MKRGSVTHILFRALFLVCALVLVVALVSIGAGFLAFISVFAVFLLFVFLPVLPPAPVLLFPRQSGRFSRAPPRG